VELREYIIVIIRKGCISQWLSGRAPTFIGL